MIHHRENYFSIITSLDYLEAPSMMVQVGTTQCIFITFFSFFSLKKWVHHFVSIVTQGTYHICHTLLPVKNHLCAYLWENDSIYICFFHFLYLISFFFLLDFDHCLITLSLLVYLGPILWWVIKILMLQSLWHDSSFLTLVIVAPTKASAFSWWRR